MSLQDLVVQALRQLVEDRRNRNLLGATIVPAGAGQLVAAAVNALGLCWNSLNTLFQAAVAQQRWQAASAFKGVMDQISLTAASIDQRILAMYEAEAAATTTAINQAVANMQTARTNTDQNPANSGEIGAAVSGLAQAVQLPG